MNFVKDKDLTLRPFAEGFERGGRAEFHQFLVIAKGSCAEVSSQLYLAFDVGYLTQEQFNILNAKTKEISRIIGGLRSSIHKQKEDHLKGMRSRVNTLSPPYSVPQY